MHAVTMKATPCARECQILLSENALLFARWGAIPKGMMSTAEFALSIQLHLSTNNCIDHYTYLTDLRRFPSASAPLPLASSL